MSKLELDAAAEFLEPRIYPATSPIYSQGDAGTEMFIVHTGTIGFFSNSESHSRTEHKPLATKGFFGEMSLINGERRVMSAYAIEDSKVLVLSGLSFHRMVWDTPMLGVKFLKAMTLLRIERLAKTSGFLDDMVRWGEKARRRAVSDDLSGLFNRRFIEEAVSARFCRGVSDSRSCALLMIDFDRFREINASYGAIAGDAVISNVGATIQRLVGNSNIAARLSGDEFAILLPDSGIDEAMELARKIQSETASLFLEFRTAPGSVSQKVSLTLSIGVASSPDHAQTCEDLFQAADRALYRAKEEGRNRVCKYNPEKHTSR